MKRVVFTCILVLGLGLMNGWSQPQPPPDPGDVPIDGGLSWLVASGIGYGVYRYKKNKTINKDS
ncbi:MAG TPA: hypothetical protein VK750_00050 [Cytophagaceae bacterium]|jgi:hypothetical protein|nr:hypothetical protein [Cytophagaceae bacterium]